MKTNTTYILLNLWVFFFVVGGALHAQNQSESLIKKEAKKDDKTSYICKMCNAHLFDDSKVTLDEHNQLHFVSGLAGHVEGGVQCDMCDHHIGAYDEERGIYLVSIENLHKEEGDGYHCSGCHHTLFQESALLSADDKHYHFSQIIKEPKSRPADKNNYFKIDIGMQAMSCHGCEATVGTVTDSDHQTFEAELKPSMLTRKGG